MVNSKSNRYLKLDVAHCYYPDIFVQMALTYLDKRIVYNDELRKQIYLTAADAMGEYFSQRQVDLLVHYLGKPKINIEEYAQ